MRAAAFCNVCFVTVCTGIRGAWRCAPARSAFCICVFTWCMCNDTQIRLNREKQPLQLNSRLYALHLDAPWVVRHLAILRTHHVLRVTRSSMQLQLQPSTAPRNIYTSKDGAACALHAPVSSSARPRKTGPWGRSCCPAPCPEGCRTPCP